MSHHERPATTIDIHNTLSQDRPFSPYSPDYAAPNLYVPRNVYGADGKPRRDSEGRPVTTPEAGWFPIGAGSEGGVEYTRVQRNEWDPRTRTFNTLTKDIPTDQLQELQKTMETVEQENARRRAMGKDATALVQGDPAAVLSRTPDSVPPVDNDPQTWALTPDEHAAFQRELRSAQPPASPEFIDRIPDWVTTRQEPAPAPKVESVEERRATILARIEQLTQGVSEADKGRLANYARYQRDKAQAQVKGDGRGSESSGQYAGQEYRRMAPEAQAIASQYQTLWVQLPS